MGSFKIRPWREDDPVGSSQTRLSRDAHPGGVLRGQGSPTVLRRERIERTFTSLDTRGTFFVVAVQHDLLGQEIVLKEPLGRHLKLDDALDRVRLGGLLYDQEHYLLHDLGIQIYPLQIQHLYVLRLYLFRLYLLLLLINHQVL